MSNTLKIVLGIFIALVVIIGGRAIFRNKSAKVTQPTSSTAMPLQIPQNQTNIIPTSTASTTTTVKTAPLMQSTGELFSQYKYASKAYEIFPKLAAGAKKALGAFSYTKTDLGDNEYRFTLVNNAEGYHGQSVIVSNDQLVYFIEPSIADDSASEDSITTDDILMVVNAQGYILK